MEPIKLELDKLVELLDTAITSDNVLVQEALRKLLFAAALVSAPAENRSGPLAELSNRVESMQRDINTLGKTVYDLKEELYYTNRDRAFGRSKYDTNAAGWYDLNKSYNK